MPATKPAPTSPTSPPPAARGRVFRLTYSNVRPEDHPELFKCRDGVAGFELAAALFEAGYRYGTTVYLYPDDDRKLTDFPAFQPSDILVLTTRPPLHDQAALIPSRKVIHAAKTELEAVLFAALGEYFEFCTRKHMVLTKRGADCLRVEQPQKWAHVELYEYCGAEILKHHVGPEVLKRLENRRSSIAFFFRANRLPRINCDFVASFGMDGFGTLIWNRIIRTRFPEWLTSPRFVMAELIYKQPFPDKPITPEFVDSGQYVEVRLLT